MEIQNKKNLGTWKCETQGKGALKNGETRHEDLRKVKSFILMAKVGA
jgi:hypothetical protein